MTKVPVKSRIPVPTRRILPNQLAKKIREKSLSIQSRKERREKKEASKKNAIPLLSKLKGAGRILKPLRARLLTAEDSDEEETIDATISNLVPPSRARVALFTDATTSIPAEPSTMKAKVPINLSGSRLLVPSRPRVVGPSSVLSTPAAATPKSKNTFGRLPPAGDGRSKLVEVNKLKEVNEILKQQLAEAQVKLEQCQAEMGQLESTVDEQQLKLAVAEESIQQERQKSDVIANGLDQCQQKMKELESTVEDKEQKVTKADEMLRQERTNSDEQKKQLDQCQYKIGQLESTVQHMEQKLEESADCLKQERARLQTVERNLQNSEFRANYIQTADEKKQRRCTDIVSLELEMEQKDAMLAIRYKRLEQQNAQLEKANTVSTQLQGELSERTIQLNTANADLAALNDRHSATLADLMKKDQENRRLLNAVVDMKGQIRVAVRVRPLLSSESAVETDHLTFPTPTTIRIEQNGRQSSFDFQRVFGPNMNQQNIFDDMEELVQSSLHGYNVSIIAYGQTGSGKTYTMRGGDDSESGIIPRSVQFLFAAKQKLADIGWQFTFSASVLEVYNEEVYDLLADRSKVEVFVGNGPVEVEGLLWKNIETEQDIIPLLSMADSLRSTAATKCNEQSSRSHALFQLKIDAKNAQIGQSLSSCLLLVDLAGSERQKESGAEGDRFKEMTSINQALANFHNCIRQQMAKLSHIQYRNSRLTMLLKDSLGGGSSKTLVLVTLNPAIENIQETKRSIEFAQQMSLTKIGAAVKQDK